MVFRLQIAGDDGAEDRVETRFQFLRQARDLLCDIIDADHRGRGEQTQYRQIEPAAAPFGGVGGGERQVAAGERVQLRRSRAPSPGQTIAAPQGPQRGEHRRNDRGDIRQDQAVARRIEEQRPRRDADRPWLDNRPCPHRGGDVEPVCKRGQRNVGPDDREDGQRQIAVEPVERAVGKHQLRHRDQHRRAQRRGKSRNQHRIADDMRVGPILTRQGLCQPAPQAQRRQLGDKFDDQDRIGETPQHLRPVQPPGDEQEGDTRGKPQDKAEHIGPPAPGERLQIGFVLVGHGCRQTPLRLRTMRRTTVGQ